MSRMLTTYVCAYKSSGQLALKQGHLSMVPLTRGHLPYKVTLGLVKFALFILNYQGTKSEITNLALDTVSTTCNIFLVFKSGVRLKQDFT